MSSSYGNGLDRDLRRAGGIFPLASRLSRLLRVRKLGQVELRRTALRPRCARCRSVPGACYFSCGPHSPHILAKSAQVLQSLLHVGHGHAHLPATAIALGQEQQFVKILGRVQPPPRTGSQRALAISQCLLVMLDQPGRPRRDQSLQDLQRGGHMVARIDRLAHVVQQCGQQKFFVIRQFLPGQLEDLQAVVRRASPSGWRSRSC